MTLPQTKVRVFAFTLATGAPVTGGAAAITAKWAKDYGTPTALTDTNPTEAEDGFYYFDLTASERDVTIIGEIFPESSTSGVQVIGVPGYFVADDPTVETKVDTLTSNLSALSGITSAAADTGLAIKATTDTLAAKSIPVVHVSITESTPVFNALHDAPSLGAHWTAERGDMVYNNTEGTTRAAIDGNVKGWRDQVNGWLATQVGVNDGPFYEIENNRPVVRFTGASGQGLEIDAAGDGLFRNIPYAYVFIAHKYADQETEQWSFSHATGNNSNQHRVGCALNNNGARLWAKSRFDGGVDANAILDAELDSAHGVWSIGTYVFRWADGVITVRRNAGTFDPDASLGASGNSSDTDALFRCRIGSSLTSAYGTGIIGPIGEIVVCRPAIALSSSQLDDIAAAMMTKWGVA